MKTFDEITMLTNDATELFKGSFKEDAHKKQQLREACDAIDALIQELDCVSCDAEIDADTKEILITLTCRYFEICFPAKNLRKASKNAKRLKFKSADDEHSEVIFTFDGIWVPVS